MTTSSQKRIEAFVGSFICSEFVSNWSDVKDRDFCNAPERAERCADAAENGADGRTYAEVIEDWREAFAAYIRDKRLWAEPERFVNAVNDHFSAIEQWHSEHGSLHQKIG